MCFRESEANPEEIEYVNIQEELNEQLLDQYKQVERVIGEWADRLITGKLLSGHRLQLCMCFKFNFFDVFSCSSLMHYTLLSILYYIHV